MSRQVSSIFKGLASAIDDLELPVDNGVLTDAFTLADRLNAKLLAAVGEHDTAELWRNDGATSMTAWLRHHTNSTAAAAATDPTSTSSPASTTSNTAGKAGCSTGRSSTPPPSSAGTHHHHLLHTPGWHTNLRPDATLTATTPHGRTLEGQPPSRPPPRPRW